MTDHTLETLRAEWAQAWAPPTPSCPVLLPPRGPCPQITSPAGASQVRGQDPWVSRLLCSTCRQGICPHPECCVLSPLPPPFLSPFFFRSFIEVSLTNKKGVYLRCTT